MNASLTCDFARRPPFTFPQFPRLPPELRLAIWKLVIPSPGINFFNVHGIPVPKLSCYRYGDDIVPARLFLDMRRLDITHNDESVSKYDISSWQARNVLMRTCHEARAAVTPKEGTYKELPLTIPSGGLSLHKDDGLLRRLTFYHTINGSEGSSLLHRRVRILKDEMTVLMFENCSFHVGFEKWDYIIPPDDDLHYTDGDNESVLVEEYIEEEHESDDDVDEDEYEANRDEELDWYLDCQFGHPSINIALQNLEHCVGISGPCGRPSRWGIFCFACRLLEYKCDQHNGSTVMPSGLHIMEQQYYTHELTLCEQRQGEGELGELRLTTMYAKSSNRYSMEFFDRLGDMYSISNKKHGTCGRHDNILSRISPMTDLWRDYITSAQVWPPIRPRRIPYME